MDDPAVVLSLLQTFLFNPRGKQAHGTQVLVLSHLCLQQKEQVESNYKELRQLSALVEQNQELLQSLENSSVEHQKAEDPAMAPPRSSTPPAG